MTKTITATMMTCLAGLLSVTGALIWTGCDTAGAYDSLTLSPGAATLSSGQSQEFTVSGGYQYTWSLTSASASSTSGVSSASGSLSAKTGSTVVYTAPASESGLSGSVTLRVVSSIEGSGMVPATTNSASTSYEVSADAVITFH